MRKLWIFFIDNKVVVLVTFAVVVLISLSFYGFGKMDSFFRDRYMAEMPLYVIIGCVHTAVFIYMHMLFFRGMGKKNRILVNNVMVSFKDVIGLENAKREAGEVVQLVKDRKQLKKIGGKIIKGILLMGPPGCGKTLLAKAIATECNIPFVSTVGSEFNEIFVGVGASRVRNLFKKARKYANVNGACVVFIDEIDVIGRSRDFSYYGGSETNATQNQLLAEMDGIDSGRHNIIVIAATNASEKILDKALLRPGRFDRKIAIALPNLKEREQLFDFYLKKIKVVPEVDRVKLAKKTVWKSPAEIENMVKEAALIATRKKKEVVDMKDFLEAMDRIELGMETHLDMTPKELEMVAYHEAGHAVVIYLMHPNDDVFKVTVKSHPGSLGLVSYIAREEIYSPDKNKFLADIMVSLASYAAEKIKYNTTTVGVSGDFAAAMVKANMMVWKVGMGNSGFIGDFSAIPSEQMSQSLKEKLNNETISIINSCYTKVEEFLKENWDAVDAVAKKLIVNKELDFDELEEVMDTIGKKKKIQDNLM